MSSWLRSYNSVYFFEKQKFFIFAFRLNSYHLNSNVFD